MSPGWRHQPRSNLWRLKNAAGQVIAVVSKRGAHEFVATVSVVGSPCPEHTTTGTIALAKAWAFAKVTGAR